MRHGTKLDAGMTLPPSPPYPLRKEDDPIRPAHYHTGDIDVIKFAEANFPKEELRGFYRINILKYVTRYDKKNGIEDLAKAEFYRNKLKELEESK